jgi:chromosome segregation ATPase
VQIKSRYIIVAFVVLLFASFCSGWFLSGHYSCQRVDELESRIIDYETELEEYGNRQGRITDALRWAARANSELVGEIESLGESNKRLTERIGDFGGTISEDIGRLSDLEERIQYYIGQGEKTGNPE